MNPQQNCGLGNHTSLLVRKDFPVCFFFLVFALTITNDLIYLARGFNTKATVKIKANVWNGYLNT